MYVTTNDSLADLLLTLDWHKDGIHHKDSYFADEANLYRDYFIPVISDKLFNREKGEKLTFNFKPGELIPTFRDKEVHRIRPWQIDTHRIPSDPPGLRKGRHYPRGIISGITAIFKENVFPFRVLDVLERQVVADFNHALSGETLCLTLDILDVKPKTKERGGLSTDWLDMAIHGPGIQARQNGSPVDFFSGRPFERDDADPDHVFYTKDRLVSHVDDKARENLAKLYGRYLIPGSRVLDLMSSWQSHLPGGLDLASVVGLGMNEKELAENPQLTDYRVHDLNKNPTTPFEDKTFDAVICSLSVEYLTRPFEVFADIARILKPGGQCIMTFSNRWFPTKTIRIWPELHEFERLALVTEYFRESGRFVNLETVSLRGYPRPYTDDYFPGLKLSDPVYMVRGITVS